MRGRALHHGHHGSGVHPAGRDGAGRPGSDGPAVRGAQGLVGAVGGVVPGDFYYFWEFGVGCCCAGCGGWR